MLRAVVDDLLRRHRPAPGKRVELLDGRAVEVHRARCGGQCARGAARRRGGRGAAPRNDHLLPVGDELSQVDE